VFILAYYLVGRKFGHASETTPAMKSKLATNTSKAQPDFATTYEQCVPYYVSDDSLMWYERERRNAK